MKKIIICMLFMLNYLVAEELTICPLLNIESTTKEELSLSAELENSLKDKLPTMFEVYMDILKKYNKTPKNPQIYINTDSLMDLSHTQIWETLLDLRYKIESLDKNSTGYKLMNKIYNQILDSINPQNPTWCYAESYNKAE